MSRSGYDTESLRRSERNRKGKTGGQNRVPTETSEQRTLEFNNQEEVLTVHTEIPETNPVFRTMAGRSFPRLKYRKFRGDGKDDVDDWLCEFNSTAAANLEEVDTKLRIFQGLLKGEALHWYQDLSGAIRNDWDELTNTFLRTFREVGGEARTLGRLSRMKMGRDEAVRRYGQRVRSLIHKLTPGIAPSVQIEWYVAGFPDDMGFHVRQARPRTLQEAMEAAQNYEDSMQSMRQSRRSSKSDGAKRGKKISKNRKKDYSESSDSSSSGSSEDESSTGSESEDSVPQRRSSRTKGFRKDRDRVVVKVKEELPEGKRLLKDIQSSLAAITVQLAEKSRPRKAIPVIRTNVWCTRCGQQGHYPNECTNAPSGSVRFVGEDGASYYMEPEYDRDELEVIPVYQVAPTYGRGRSPSLMIRPQFVPGRSGSSGQTSGEIKGAPRNPVSFERQYGLCFTCGQPGHYAPECPHGGRQGAPVKLPCQNCGHYGHVAPECQQPVKPKVVFKQVETPPRSQTALNYGHQEGVDNPTN